MAPPSLTPWYDFAASLLENPTPDALMTFAEARINMTILESRPLLHLLGDHPQAICFISTPTVALTLLFWFVSLLSSEAVDYQGMLHLITVGWWSRQHHLDMFGGLINGRHLTINTMDAFPRIEALPPESQCSLAVVDLDTFPPSFSDPSNPTDWILPKLSQASGALGFHQVLLYSTCTNHLLLMQGSQHLPPWEPPPSSPPPPPPPLLTLLATIKAPVGICAGETPGSPAYYESREGTFWLLSTASAMATLEATSIADEEESWSGQRVCEASETALAETSSLGRSLGGRPMTGSPPFIMIIACMQTGSTSADKDQRALLESLVSSLLLTSSSTMTLFIIGNRAAAPILQEVAIAMNHLHTHLPHRQQAHLTLHIHVVEVERGLMQYYRPCALLRLELLALLPASVDLALYLDTDMVLLEDVSGLWEEFQFFGPDDAVGVVAEHGCCSRDAYYRPGSVPFPYWGPTGLNGGMLLLNITRLRQGRFNAAIEDAIHNSTLYKTMHFGDQDLLNIVLADTKNVGSTRAIDCRWNYRPDFCLFEVNDCPRCTSTPVLLHGSRAASLPRAQSTIPAFTHSRRLLHEYAMGYLEAIGPAPPPGQEAGDQDVDLDSDMGSLQPFLAQWAATLDRARPPCRRLDNATDCSPGDAPLSPPDNKTKPCQAIEGHVLEAVMSILQSCLTSLMGVGGSYGGVSGQVGGEVVEAHMPSLGLEADGGAILQG